MKHTLAWPVSQFTAAVLVVSLLSGCGSNPKATSTTAATTTAPATTSTTTSLVGTWTSSCRTDGPTPYRVELMFNQTILVETTRYYNESSCSATSQFRQPTVVWTLYKAGDAVPGLSGAHALDLGQPMEGIPPFNIYQINGSTLQVGRAQAPEEGLLRRPSALNTDFTFQKTA